MSGMSNCPVKFKPRGRWFVFSRKLCAVVVLGPGVGGGIPQHQSSSWGRSAVSHSLPIKRPIYPKIAWRSNSHLAIFLFPATNYCLLDV